MELSESERMVRGFGDRIRSYKEVKHLFNYTCPYRNAVTKCVVYKTVQRFEETGSVNYCGRPRPALNEDLSLDVLQSAVALRALHQNQYKPYKIHLVQELSEDDFDRRVEFCKLMMANIDNKPIGLNNCFL
ncbi:hypothetical protein J6590_000455 [Homalodisca vitripennis]|nr:hypothetical protein J6590_000455 [Homalodisca vitripennis]